MSTSRKAKGEFSEKAVPELSLGNILIIDVIALRLQSRNPSGRAMPAQLRDIFPDIDNIETENRVC